MDIGYVNIIYVITLFIIITRTQNVLLAICDKKNFVTVRRI